MSYRPIAYNLVRLIMGSIHTTPRGVDRQDFGYLSYLLDHWPADVVGVMPTILGFRCFSRAHLLRGRDRLRALWQEDLAPEQDPALARLIARLHDDTLPEPAGKPRSHLPDREGWRRIRQLILAEGLQFGQPVTAMPANALYLDFGHYGLTFPGTFRWRPKRPDVTPVFLVHDAIPLEHPEMVTEESVRSHGKLVDMIGRHARVLITSTQAAADALNGALVQRGAAPVETFINPLAIDELFLTPQAPVPALAGEPYFVVCGAVEPRKNHALLFEVWRRLIARHGTAAPRLIVAGSPGYRSAEILAPLAAEPGLRHRIVFAKGLASPSLARVMAGAQALLMPSFAEGFGLPPVEALSLGVPALLSDIGAHREAAGTAGHFLPPDQPEPWVAAIEALLEPAHAQAERARVAGFRPVTWPEHMARTSAFLQTL